MPNARPPAAIDGPAGPCCERCGDPLDDPTSAVLGVCPSCDLVTHLAHAATDPGQRARFVEAVRAQPGPPAFTVYQQRARGEPATRVGFADEQEARNFAALQLLDGDYLRADVVLAGDPPPAWWVEARDPRDDEFADGLVAAVADALLFEFHRVRRLPSAQAWPRIARAALRAVRDHAAPPEAAGA